MAALGPLGIAAFGLAIVGVIASIINARRTANKAMAGLGVPSDVGNLGGAIPSVSTVVPSQPTPTTPTGISAEDVFSQQAPIRAFVLQGDITDGEEAAAKLNQRRTLG